MPSEIQCDSATCKLYHQIFAQKNEILIKIITYSTSYISYWILEDLESFFRPPLTPLLPLLSSLSFRSSSSRSSKASLQEKRCSLGSQWFPGLAISTYCVLRIIFLVLLLDCCFFFFLISPHILMAF